MERDLGKRARAILVGLAVVLSAAGGVLVFSHAIEQRFAPTTPNHASGVQPLVTVSGAEARYCLSNQTSKYTTLVEGTYTIDLSSLVPYYQNNTDNTVGCNKPHWGSLVTVYGAAHTIVSEGVSDVFTVNVTNPFQGNFTAYTYLDPIVGTALANETEWKTTLYGSSFHVYDCPGLVCTTKPQWAEPQYGPRPLATMIPGLSKPCGDVTWSSGSNGIGVEICGQTLQNILTWLAEGAGAIGAILWILLTDGGGFEWAWEVYQIITELGQGFMNWLYNYCGGCIYFTMTSYQYTQCWWIYCWTVTVWYVNGIGCGSPPSGYSVVSHFGRVVRAYSASG